MVVHLPGCDPPGQWRVAGVPAQVLLQEEETGVRRQKPRRDKRGREKRRREEETRQEERRDEERKRRREEERREKRENQTSVW